MRKRIFSLAAASALLLAVVLPALAADQDATSDKIAPETGKVTIEMKATNDSGVSGKAVLTQLENNKTRVEITLSGMPSGAIEPAHIHTGKCPNVGAIKWPLSNVVNGVSTTDLDVSLTYLKSQLPLAINTHKSAEEMKVFMSCGNFPGKKVVMKTVDVKCVKAAITKRDDAIVAAQDVKYAALKAAVVARRAALLAAWDMTDVKARAAAWLKAWKDDWTAVNKANKDFKTARNAAWKQFQSDRKTCGPVTGSEDGNREGYDAQL